MLTNHRSSYNYTPTSVSPSSPPDKVKTDGARPDHPSVRGGPYSGVFMDKLQKLDALIHKDREIQEYGKPVIPHLDWQGVMSQVGEGMILEFGVYYAASFMQICAQVQSRKVYGFDWFWGLTEDWGWPGTTGSASCEGKVPECPRNGEYVLGKVELTLPVFLGKNAGQVAFCHFDLDTYTPTRIALALLNSRFFTGTILAFDEIDGDMQQKTKRNLEHEQKAFREWLLETEFDFEIIGRRHGESWIVRLI